MKPLKTHWRLDKKPYNYARFPSFLITKFLMHPLGSIFITVHIHFLWWMIKHERYFINHKLFFIFPFFQDRAALDLKEQQWKWVNSAHHPTCRKKRNTTDEKSGPQMRFLYGTSNLKMGARNIDEIQQAATHSHFLRLCVCISQFFSDKMLHVWSCGQASGPIRRVELSSCKSGVVSAEYSVLSFLRAVLFVPSSCLPLCSPPSAITMPLLWKSRFYQLAQIVKSRQSKPLLTVTKYEPPFVNRLRVKNHL